MRYTGNPDEFETADEALVAWEVREARARRWEWEHVGLNYPWTVTGNVTFGDDTVSEQGCKVAFHRWFEAQAWRLIGSPANWFATPEYQERGVPHMQFLAGNFPPGLAPELERSWPHGLHPWGAHIRPFDESRRVKGVSYTVKMVPEGGEPLWGGPAFPSAPGLPRPEEWIWRFGPRWTLKTLADPWEAELICGVLEFLRECAGPGRAPWTSARLLEWSSQNFLAGPRLRFRERVEKCLALLRWKAGLRAAIVRPARVRAAPADAAGLTSGDVLRVRFDIYKHKRISQFWTINQAVLAAKRMSRGMTTTRAISWILLDAAVTFARFRRDEIGGEDGWKFIARNLAKLASGDPVVFAEDGNRVLFDPADLDGIGPAPGSRMWLPEHPAFEPGWPAPVVSMNSGSGMWWPRRWDEEDESEPSECPVPGL